MATERIKRWLGVTKREAEDTFRRSLISEAQEEADTVYFERHPEELVGSFRIPEGEPTLQPGVIYAGLHLGSPILAYLYLCRGRGIDATAVGRKLDSSNPMPEAKRRYGSRKVAWVESFAGQPFLGVDGAAMAQARDRLLAGKSLYAVIDVPGDVVGRNAGVTVFGERVVFASGIITLAHLTHSPLQPVVAISHPCGFNVHYGCPLEMQGKSPTVEEVMQTMAGLFIGRFPGEWWLWPYLASSRD